MLLAQTIVKLFHLQKKFYHSSIDNQPPSHALTAHAQHSMRTFKYHYCTCINSPLQIAWCSFRWCLRWGTGCWSPFSRSITISCWLVSCTTQIQKRSADRSNRSTVARQRSDFSRHGRRICASGVSNTLDSASLLVLLPLVQATAWARCADYELAYWIVHKNWFIVVVFTSLARNNRNF